MYTTLGDMGCLDVLHDITANVGVFAWNIKLQHLGTKMLKNMWQMKEKYKDGLHTLVAESWTVTVEGWRDT